MAIKVKKSVEKAAEVIRNLIQAGHFPPGTRIRQEELVKHCGVSRTPIRDALRSLEKEGLVELRANNGAYVNHWHEDELEIIFELRADLESIAARRAASRISEPQLGELERLAKEMEQLAAEDHILHETRIRAANREFHRVILAAAGSRQLSTMVLLVLEAPHSLRSLRKYRKEDIHRSMVYHREILEAMRNRDPRAAASVMRTHVDASYRPMVQHLDRGGLPGIGDSDR